MPSPREIAQCLNYDDARALMFCAQADEMAGATRSEAARQYLRLSAEGLICATGQPGKSPTILTALGRSVVAELETPDA